ncbi:MAG: bifunctional precorrin-2 dehydrogenase/sirohydrochlorin ferrochelatase [Candidatus Binatus sp.]|uniref:precorrin-2 dehydrogenase/sirohydrochlorin ferrochelatase family protein n=1 Tax=Candidatus Binatus sp. TaxID=2811406 RepID=UPI0027213D8E|nr:bifunctional precorrin-2 dehydrogenase/sirohydrochlorin ferrochelatase [Candidatus Binatus sp.]MDO8431811.1 bifunctional precorrin-2 dehydrogenase/sirohydrochlorin ferrochelatase [Candidatus Binatus sp.]
MGYLPIFLDVTGRKCIVVGGGEVAARKAESLLDADATVTVVCARLNDTLDAMFKRREIAHIARPYRRGDMAGCALVYAATDDSALNRELAAEARELGILLNVADVPELCDFIAPAIVKQGALQIAISTGGASPAFVARLRRQLEEQFGDEYGHALRILRAARNHLRSQRIELGERSRRLKALAESELPDALRHHDLSFVERIVAACLGDGVSLGTLGIDAESLALSNGLSASR